MRRATLPKWVDVEFRGTPVQMSGMPPRVPKAFPAEGEDTHELFGALLGLSLPEIQRLEGERVLY